MTSLERVLCALRGEPSDRRAFTLALSLYGARLSGCPIPSYYSDPMRYLDGQGEVVRLMDPDIVFAPFVLPFEAFLRLSGAFFDAGAAFVAVPVMFANLRLVTPVLLEKTILPELSRAFGQARGPLVYHHGGNRILDHLFLCSGLPNVAGFLLDPRDNLSQARELLGAQRLMLGNVNGPGLSGRQPGDVYSSVSTLLADRVADRSYILASAHADIPFDTNPGVLLAVCQAVLDAGTVA